MAKFSGNQSSQYTPTSAFAQTTTPANTGGLFGPSIRSHLIGTAFGTSVATGAASLFGTTTSQVPAAGGMFGAQPTAAGTSLFGQTAVAQPMANGTVAIKFNPPLEQDTMMNNYQHTTVNMKHHCITAMKEYEMKSFEELRVDDYLGGRKRPQQQQTATGLFGAAAPIVGTSLFGCPATAARFNRPRGIHVFVRVQRRSRCYHPKPLLYCRSARRNRWSFWWRRNHDNNAIDRLHLRRTDRRNAWRQPVLFIVWRNRKESTANVTFRNCRYRNRFQFWRNRRQHFQQAGGGGYDVCRSDHFHYHRGARRGLF